MVSVKLIAKMLEHWGVLIPFSQFGEWLWSIMSFCVPLPVPLKTRHFVVVVEALSCESREQQGLRVR
jgi:hypothetical protein